MGILLGSGNISGGKHVLKEESHNGLSEDVCSPGLFREGWDLGVAGGILTFKPPETQPEK